MSRTRDHWPEARQGNCTENQWGHVVGAFGALGSKAPGAWELGAPRGLPLHEEVYIMNEIPLGRSFVLNLVIVLKYICLPTLPVTSQPPS
jgi:hypothetical protein